MLSEEVWVWVRHGGIFKSRVSRSMVVVVVVLVVVVIVITVAVFVVSVVDVVFVRDPLFSALFHLPAGQKFICPQALPAPFPGTIFPTTEERRKWGRKERVDAVRSAAVLVVNGCPAKSMRFETVGRVLATRPRPPFPTFPQTRFDHPWSYAAFQPLALCSRLFPSPRCSTAFPFHRPLRGCEISRPYRSPYRAVCQQSPDVSFSGSLAHVPTVTRHNTLFYARYILVVSHPFLSRFRAQGMWMATRGQLRKLNNSCGYLRMFDELTTVGHVETHSGSIQMFSPNCGLEKARTASITAVDGVPGR